MKKRKGYLKIIDSDGKIIFHGMITDLPLKETYIYSKSLELFNEKEPCIIYRTHIMKKFYLELYDFLSQRDGNVTHYPDVVGFLKAVDININQTEQLFFDE